MNSVVKTRIDEACAYVDEALAEGFGKAMTFKQVETTVQSRVHNARDHLEETIGKRIDETSTLAQVQSITTGLSHNLMREITDGRQVVEIALRRLSQSVDGVTRGLATIDQVDDVARGLATMNQIDWLHSDMNKIQPMRDHEDLIARAVEPALNTTIASLIAVIVKSQAAQRRHSELLRMQACTIQLLMSQITKANASNTIDRLERQVADLMSQHAQDKNRIEQHKSRMKILESNNKRLEANEVSLQQTNSDLVLKIKGLEKRLAGGKVEPTPSSTQAEDESRKRQRYCTPSYYAGRGE